MNYNDLDSLGFCIIKDFLSKEDIDFIYNNYTQTPINPNKNYNISVPTIPVMSLLIPKLDLIIKQVSTNSTVHAEFLTSDFLYTDNQRIKFDWHQDHESYFVFQQSYNYINCYIPIKKQNESSGGMSIVPMNYLKDNHNNLYNKVVNKGAQHFNVVGKTLRIVDSENNEIYNYDLDIENVAVSPVMNAGDLLILRGDVIHKTQDTNSQRVAISIRYTDGHSPISKQRLFNTSNPKKKEMLYNNKDRYAKIFNYFESNQIDIALAKDVFANENSILLSQINKK